MQLNQYKNSVVEMGRKRNIFVRDFFYYNDAAKESTCKTCGGVFQGSYASNLKRHLKTKHKEIYTSIEMDVRGSEDEDESKKSFRISFSIEDVQNACIDLATEEYLPFSLFDAPPFKFLTQQIFKGLEIPEVTSKNIMVNVFEKANNIKESIQRNVKGKLISLKLDVVTALDLAVLGVNVQMIRNREIVIYTLGTIELSKRLTSHYLQVEVEKLLEEFNIHKRQIYSIITDNGRDMLKTEELFSINDVDDEENANYNVYNDLIESITFENVYSVKCIAHTLRLTVEQFLEGACSELIIKARRIVKSLRSPDVRYKASNLRLKIPQLDVPTKWNSTFKLLKELIGLKAFCEEEFRQNETEPLIDWLLLEELVKVLNPVYSMILKLQEKRILLGDFYKIWLELKVILESYYTEFAKIMLQHLKDSESNILDNEFMIAALYLDPRLRRTLSKEKKEAAKKHLKKTAFRLCELNKKQMDSQKPSTSSTLTHQANEIFIKEEPVDSVSYLLSQSVVKLEVDNSSEDCNLSLDSDPDVLLLQNEIDLYCDRRHSIHETLISYWESQKYRSPRLYQLAMISHGVPATQVSVHRAFTALKLILSDRQYNLKENKLETLLFVKLNKTIKEISRDC